MRHLRRASLGALVAATLLALSLGADADAAKTPSTLLTALLKAKVTSLPHGYKTPRIAAYQVTAAAKAHHAIGGVEIEGDSGNEAIIYIVYSSAAEAKLNWQHANLSNAHVGAAPKTIPKPSFVANESTTAPNSKPVVKIGITEVACLTGDVIVEGATTSFTNPDAGDLAGAVALEQFALAHLKSVS